MASFTLPALITRGAPDLTVNCTIATCDISSSYWWYLPSLPANAILLSLFSLSLISFITTHFVFPTRRFTAFTIALCAGCTLEILGYIGRLMSHANPWHQLGFLLQICCLTIAPAFIAAGVYMCLRRVVETFGREHSRVAPELYTRFFIACDVLSLVLQATGGGMASAAYHKRKSSALGDHVMVAGLGSQVFTLAIFMALSVDFAITVRSHERHSRSPRGSPSPMHKSLRKPSSSKTGSTAFRFRVFLAALATTTVCIFVRSVYRVIELSEGWQGRLIRQQWLFVGLEGVMVVIAVAALNVGHPAICFVEDNEAGFDIGVEAGSKVTRGEKKGSA